MHGQFFWYDLMTTDVAAAARFYSDLIGWETMTPASDMPYTVFTLEGQGVAGLMPIPQEAAAHGTAPAWMGYIAVDDVDAAVEQLQAKGGRLLRGPVTVPDIIRFAVVADSQGAGFLLARGLSKEPVREFPAGTPGTVGWRELMAADERSAFAFYQSLYRWTLGERYESPGMPAYQLFNTSSTQAGGVMTKPASVPQPHWNYVFNVEAIDAAHQRLLKGGGITLMPEPMQVPGGQWVLHCRDPLGATFAMVAAGR